MSRLFACLAASAAALLIATQAVAVDQKIGYVDFDRITNEHKAFAEAQEKVKQSAEDFKRQIQTRQDELARLADDFKRQELLLSPEKKAQLQANLAKKDEENQAFTEEIFGQSGKLAQKQDELVKPIYDRIMTAIQGIAEAENYDLILSKAALPFAKIKYDITDKVLAELNKPTSK